MKLMILLITVVGSEAAMFPSAEGLVKDRSSRLNLDSFQTPETQTRLIKRYPMPPQQDRRIREWSTSRKEGWQGRKDAPGRSGSPQGSPPPAKPPVLIDVSAKGPARLEVFGSQRPPEMTVYKVPAGKTFQKEFQDPKKLKVDGYAKEEPGRDGERPRAGRIRLLSIGGKSYTALDGKLEGPNKLESIGPGLRSKRGALEAIEMNLDNKEMAYFKPPQNTTTSRKVYQSGSVRNSSKDGQATTMGLLHGNIDNPKISSQVSNSPSHSPPPSPGKPIPGFEHVWPSY